jgi:hypothetical protein
MAYRERDELLEHHQTWIGYVRPEGVVVAPHVLSDRQVAPETSASVLRVRQAELLLHLDPNTFAFRDDYAVRSLGKASSENPWQLLIGVAPPGIDVDSVPTGQEGWPASQEQRFERLLRGKKVFAGLLIGWARDASKRLRPVIRLVYADRKGGKRLLKEMLGAEAEISDPDELLFRSPRSMRDVEPEVRLKVRTLKGVDVGD